MKGHLVLQEKDFVALCLSLLGKSLLVFFSVFFWTNDFGLLFVLDVKLFIGPITKAFVQNSNWSFKSYLHEISLWAFATQIISFLPLGDFWNCLETIFWSSENKLHDLQEGTIYIRWGGTWPFRESSPWISVSLSLCLSSTKKFIGLFLSLASLSFL